MQFVKVMREQYEKYESIMSIEYKFRDEKDGCQMHEQKVPEAFNQYFFIIFAIHVIGYRGEWIRGWSLYIIYDYVHVLIFIISRIIIERRNIVTYRAM